MSDGCCGEISQDDEHGCCGDEKQYGVQCDVRQNDEHCDVLQGDEHGCCGVQSDDQQSDEHCDVQQNDESCGVLLFRGYERESYDEKKCGEKLRDHLHVSASQSF